MNDRLAAGGASGRETIGRLHSIDMKLRDFLKTSLLLPFGLWTQGKAEQLVEVVPKSLDELPGLIVEHRMAWGIEKLVIHSRIQDGWFSWFGHEVVNWKMNKFWGYQCDDPKRKKQLIVIDTSDLQEPEYFRFYRPTCAPKIPS